MATREEYRRVGREKKKNRKNKKEELCKKKKKSIFDINNQKNLILSLPSFFTSHSGHYFINIDSSINLETLVLLFSRLITQYVVSLTDV